MITVTYLFLGLSFFGISHVSNAAEDDMMSCLELFNPENVDKMCCESLESFDKIGEDIEECIKEDSEEWICEDFKCILRKQGMLKDDNIDEEVAKKFFSKMETDYPKDKPIIERLRRECLNGKYLNYPPEDACPAVKYYVCTYINTYVECDSWKKTDICTQMSEHAKKCKAALN